MQISENKILLTNVKKQRQLNEWVNRNEFVEAIQNHQVLYIYYAGDHTVNRGFRTIEPYCLGRSKANNLVLRAWQQAGASDTKKNATRPNDEIPGWRLFRLDGITTSINTLKTHDPINKTRPKYNPNDKGMNEVIVAINPTKQSGIQVKGLDSIDDPNTVTKRYSLFDKKAKSDQDFFSSSADDKLLFKDAVIDFYDLVKNYRKGSPKNFIVVNKNGRLTIDHSYNKPKYDDDSFMGNLEELFREYNKDKRVDKSFFEKQRRDLENMKNK